MIDADAPSPSLGSHPGDGWSEALPQLNNFGVLPAHKSPRGMCRERGQGGVAEAELSSRCAGQTLFLTQRRGS